MNSDERRAAIARRAEPIENETERLWVRGAFRPFQIYRAPVELLQLNADNRRFRAEKLQFEEDLERPLDPAASEDDELSIISILLDENHQIVDDQVQGKMGKDALALIDDWSRRGQEKSLWIRPNGWVTNGNRRLAALKRLAREHGSATGTFSFVNVIILPEEDFDDRDLFEMEAREQLTEGLKKRYTDINLLLTLREAADRQGVDWSDDASISTVASSVQDLVGNNPKYAEVQLFAIKYMDEYLDYAEQPGQYHRLIGQVERFRDIGKNMVLLKREAPEEAGDFLLLQFQGVQAGLGHLQMRVLRQIVIEDPVKIREIFDEVQEAIERHAGEPDIESGDEAVTNDPTLPFEDEEEADTPPVAAPPDFPVRPVRRILEVAIAERQTKARNDAEFTLRSAAKQLQQVTEADVRILRSGPSAEVIEKAIADLRDWLRDCAGDE
jgi:hypothetical protein